MPLSLPALDNLVRIGRLKAEPRNEAEVRRMLAMAQTRLADARLASPSPEGRFTSVDSGQKPRARRAQNFPMQVGSGKSGA